MSNESEDAGCDCREFSQPLVITELDVPAPQAGQILVKTEPCGVCHTDLHAAKGDWPVKPTPRFIPGHEAIGLVVLSQGLTPVSMQDESAPTGMGARVRSLRRYAPSAADRRRRLRRARSRVT